MKCENCNGENEADSEFCVHCRCKFTNNQKIVDNSNNQNPVNTVDVQKPAEPWTTSIEVGIPCTIITGLALGYFGTTVAIGVGLLCWLFIIRNSPEHYTRPFDRQMIIIIMMIFFAPAVSLIVQNMLIYAK